VQKIYTVGGVLQQDSKDEGYIDVLGSFKPWRYEDAERVGFEPTVPQGHNGFRDRPIQPLSHLSFTEYSKNRITETAYSCFR
jgi:hypothetical protein